MQERQHPVTYLIWLSLLVIAGIALLKSSWSVAFISGITFILTILPLFLQDWTGIKLPKGFVAAVVFFIFGTLFLGEVGDFYEKYWWWDVLLHTGSAVGFGMIGMVLVLFLVQGDVIDAPPLISSIFAFTFAVAIGALWEIFEFAMDQIFGLNMQKSGLVDTMWDLIVDCVGAFIGALAGYHYLKTKGEGSGRLSRTIAEFVKTNFKSFRS